MPYAFNLKALAKYLGVWKRQKESCSEEAGGFTQQAGGTSSPTHSGWESDQVTARLRPQAPESYGIVQAQTGTSESSSPAWALAVLPALGPMLLSVLTPIHPFTHTHSNYHPQRNSHLTDEETEARGWGEALLQPLRL